MAFSLPGYATGVPPATSAVVLAAQGTAAAAAASLAVYDNSDISIIEVGFAAAGQNSFLGTLLPLGNQLAGGKIEDAGLVEEMSPNFPEIRFKEEDDILRNFTMGASALIGDSTLTLNSSVGMQEGDILRNATTGELVRINTVPTATTVTVTRAFGTVAAVAMASAQSMIFLYNATAIGVSSRAAFGSVVQDKLNYFQKFVETVEINDQDMMSNKVTMKFVDRRMQERLIKHGRDIETAAMLGQKRTSVDSIGRAVHSTEGAIQTSGRGWTADLSGSLNGVTLEREFGRVFGYGSSVKIGLCGRNAKSNISNVFVNRINIENNETVNMKFSYIDMNGGKLLLIDHPFMDTISGYADHVCIVDPSTFSAVYPAGVGLDGKKFDGKTRFIYNTAESTHALQRGDWRTDIGFKNANANAMGLFKIV